MNDYWIDIILNISSSILVCGFTFIIDAIFIGIVVTVVAIIVLLKSSSGPRLNIKTVLSTYGDFHVKDKTAVRTSYL